MKSMEMVYVVDLVVVIRRVTEIDSRSRFLWIKVCIYLSVEFLL